MFLYPFLSFSAVKYSGELMVFEDQINPKVELVAVLRGVNSFEGLGADDIAAYAARGDFAFESSAELVQIDREKDQIGKKTKGVVARSFGKGHGSVGDQSAFVFSIKDLTRAATLQLCLPEYLEHEQQSLRRVQAKRGVYFPPALKNSSFEAKARETLEKSVLLYKDMAGIDLPEDKREGCVPEEDARYVLPLLTRTNITTKGNARELIHLKTMNEQGEAPSYVKDVVSSMHDEAKAVAPNLFARGQMNYETLAFWPSQILYASENRTLNQIIEKHGGDKASFVEYEMPEESVRRAVEERREEELANLKHVRDGRRMAGYLFPISLAGFHQTIRQRTWHHSCESVYDAAARGSVKLPKTIKDSDWKDKYMEQCDEMIGLYRELATTVPRSEAVGIIPHATMLYDFIQIDGWNAVHAIGKRTCLEAQWEIREISNQIAAHIRKANPVLGAYAQPQCLTYGFCPEERPAWAKDPQSSTCGIYKSLTKQGKLDQEKWRAEPSA